MEDNRFVYLVYTGYILFHFHQFYTLIKSFPTCMYIHIFTLFETINSLEIKIHFLCKEVWLKKWRGVPPPRYKKVQFKKKITTYMHL